MTDTPALRPGQNDLETEIWADALARFMVTGELNVPLLIPKGLLDPEADNTMIGAVPKVGWECPECGEDSPFVNVGSTHVCYCTACQVSWIWGSNLVSSWRDQTEAEQRASYEAAGISRMRRID